VSKRSGKPVEWKNIVRGYQYEKGRYVVLSDEDFRQANIKAAQTIDIAGFTDAASITPEYYETPYYVAPPKGWPESVRIVARGAAAYTESCHCDGRHPDSAAPGCSVSARRHSDARHLAFRRRDRLAGRSRDIGAEIIDLMSVLKQSLQGRGERGSRATARDEETPAATRRHPPHGRRSGARATSSRSQASAQRRS
jgi:non-homologous end joining protein Ku